jgi:hypothetical protein
MEGSEEKRETKVLYLFIYFEYIKKEKKPQSFEINEADIPLNYLFEFNIRFYSSI